MTDTLGLDCWYRSDDVDYLQLLYCEFQQYEFMTMSVVGGQPKKTRKFQL